MAQVQNNPPADAAQLLLQLLSGRVATQGGLATHEGGGDVVVAKETVVYPLFWVTLVELSVTAVTKLYVEILLGKTISPVLLCQL